MNVEGLCSRSRQYKVSMIGDIMMNARTAIAALTETHLNEDIKDAEIAIDGYQIFRSDREGRARGGVALYIKTELGADATVLSAGSNGVVEHIILHLKSMGSCHSMCL